MYLFKRVAYYLGDSSLMIQVAQMFQPLFLMFITSAMYMEINAGGISAIPIIKNTFDNDYIHILHDMAN